MKRPLAMLILAIGASLVLNTSAMSKEPERGKPKTTTRTNWCYSKLLSCIREATDDCATAHAEDARSRNICEESATGSCNSSFGNSSDCRTRPFKGTPYARTSPYLQQRTKK